ncbi:glyceraldehyde-3-phosphate dehydrogenase B, chloroplastic-like [Zingiber officinale]|uniref:glyceraldehyde-3-phosphate dehydrogenase B, chloroplastic-like n=1 Tax=Zingiber officinale TaxID=94328 RepID=UPI001C4BEEC7|nr:glyceraldehyde-3-phosphate dehydrogenase B, chloroplastic-like [Zingiber officinale]
MASHATLASSRIPCSMGFHSKTNSPCFTKTLEFAEFSGLKSCSSITFAGHSREASFSDAARDVLPKGVTVAKLKVAINGFGRKGQNFLRYWHDRKDSPLEVIVVNDSGGVKNIIGQRRQIQQEVGNFKQ